MVGAGCVAPAAVVPGVNGRCWLCGPCSSSVRCQWSVLAVWPLQQQCQVSVVGAGCVAPAAVVPGVSGSCWLCGPCSSCVRDEAVSVGVGLSAIDWQLMVQAWEGLVPGGLGEDN